MKYELRKCKHCGKEFKALLKEIKRGNAKFCSRSCSSSQKQQKEPNVVCANCGKSFYKSQSKQKNSKSGIFFCCRVCKDQSQRIGGISKIMPPHYGTADGIYSYRQTTLNNREHVCEDCGYKKHTKILVVHHVDHNRLNNEDSNLIILCPNCHAVRHYVKD